ncbi:MAG: SDR family NAD(P)-dependent oxidoreductase [Lachnospiraceae bacterium]
MNMRGKTIVVTGGGNGVGRELVFQLLRKGVMVLAIDINEEALMETKRMTGNDQNLFWYTVDIASKEDVFHFAEEAITKHGHIDGIVNNAGIIQPFVNVDSLSLERMEKVMNINYFGTLYMIKAFLPHLLKRPQAHIVNVSSMGGFLPVPGQTVYGSSKAAVKLLSEGLSSELKNTNVKVSVVIPGGIATNIMKNSNITTRDKRDKEKGSNLILQPEEAAELILRGMEKEKLVSYIGKDCKLMHLLMGIRPSLAKGLISRFRLTSN